ncbi:MAG: RNA-binding protein, partial [Pseudomonadales bacterium]|nr:RNA-binding protein [Pseudomonadales bacterium]
MRIGMIIQIRQGWEEKTVVVTGLSAKRGSATIAATLYQETRESLEARERQANERKLSGISRIISENRPDKKSRRQIHRFLRQHDQEQ